MQSAGKFLRSLRSGGRSSSNNQDAACGVGAIERRNPFYHSEGKGSRRKARSAAVAAASSAVTRCASSETVDEAGTRKKTADEHDATLVDSAERSRSFHKQLQSSGGSGSRRRFSFGSDANSRRRRDSLADKGAPAAVPAVNVPATAANGDNSPPPDSILQRDKGERRSARKLTKDSGYETSPHCESDYVSLSTRSDSGEALSDSVKSSSVEIHSGQLGHQYSSGNYMDMTNTLPTSSSDESNFRYTTSAMNGCEAMNTGAGGVDDLPVPRTPPTGSVSDSSDLGSVNSGGTLVPENGETQCRLPTSKVSTPTASPARSLHHGRTLACVSHADGGIEDRGSLTHHNKLGNMIHSSPSLQPSQTSLSSLPRGSQTDEEREQEEYAKNLRSSSYHLQHNRQWSGLNLKCAAPSSGTAVDKTLISDHQRQHSDNSICSSISSDPQVSDTLYSVECLLQSLSTNANNAHSNADYRENSILDDIEGQDQAPSLSYDLDDIDSVLASEVSEKNPSIQNIRFGPGHEKCSSWPIHSSVDQESLSYGNNRSKSLTENIDYDRERNANAARQASKKSFNAAFQQQLKPVVEKCERIGPETFLSPDERDGVIKNQSIEFPCKSPLKGYNGPSPCVHDTYSTEEQINSDISRSSLSSNITTPLLDQLCGDIDLNSVENGVKCQTKTSSWERNDHETTGRDSGRDSVATVVTYSSSNSSGNETMRLYGSYSDISVVSSSTNRSDPIIDNHSSCYQTKNVVHQHQVAHSTRIRPPMRLHSESVRLHKHRNSANIQSSGSSTNSTHSLLDGDCMASSTESVTNAMNSPTIDYSRPPSVTDRIRVLEQRSRSSRKSVHSKSVPNLLADKRSDVSITAVSNWPSSKLTKHQPADSSCDSVASESAPMRRISSPEAVMNTEQKPTSLKTLQKMAVLSYYERQKSRAASTDAGSACDVPAGVVTGAREFKRSTSLQQMECNQFYCGDSLPDKSFSPGRMSKAKEVILRAADSTRLKQTSSTSDLVSNNLNSSAQRRDNIQHSNGGSVVSHNSPSTWSAVRSNFQCAPVPMRQCTGQGDTVSDHLQGDSTEFSEPTNKNIVEQKSAFSSSSLSSRSHAIQGDSGGAASCSSPASVTSQAEARAVSSQRRGSSHGPSRPAGDVSSHKCPPARPPKKPHLRVHSSGAAPQVAAASQRVYVSSIDGGSVAPRGLCSSVNAGSDDHPLPLPPVCLQQPGSSVVRSGTGRQNNEQQTENNGDYLTGPSGQYRSTASPPPHPTSLPTPTPSPQQQPTPSPPQQPTPTPSPPQQPTPSPPQQPTPTPLPPSTPALHTETCTTPVLEAVQESHTTPDSSSPACPVGIDDQLVHTSSTPTVPPRDAVLEAVGDTVYNKRTLLNSSSTTDVTVTSPVRSRDDTCSEPGRISESSLDLRSVDQVRQRKDELVHRISGKLQVLRAEREAVREEMNVNTQLGDNISQWLQQQSAPQHQLDKYNTYVQQISTVTSLLLGLAARLARAEALLSHNCPHSTSVQSDSTSSLSARANCTATGPVTDNDLTSLQEKRDKLSTQLEEARCLKRSIDDRGLQLLDSMKLYLSDSQMHDYRHFISMKAKFAMDARELDDKIRLGQEQLAALMKTASSSASLVVSQSAITDTDSLCSPGHVQR